MAKPDLHKFEKSLKNKPGLGSTDEPRTIKAKNLDDNNKKLTLLKGEGTPALYEVKYTKEGTRITRILPVRPDSAKMHVLTITNGVVAWTETEDCDQSNGND
jgi:hypothetical protein